MGLVSSSGGKFTAFQRARSEQFEEAKAWLDTLPGPQIIVPGNHDISLYNVWRQVPQNAPDGEVYRLRLRIDPNSDKGSS